VFFSGRMHAGESAYTLCAVHLSDVTGLAFASALGQVFVYVVALILYAHLIPDLRSVRTALVAGASVVFGLAAQSTLSNVVAGFSLVLYRPIRVGDQVQLTTQKGLVTAVVQVISLGYTILLDSDENHILVPNSVMMSTIVIRIKKVCEASDSSPNNSSVVSTPPTLTS
jgi:small-conductance mechanosensitive channel